MFSKTKIALAAALILGAASAAVAANEHDDSVSEAQAMREQHGNPLPWWWNTPPQGRASVANAGNAFGFNPSAIQQEDLPRKKSHSH
jgi:Spy/CpxP family protein refolding chaperone